MDPNATWREFCYWVNIGDPESAAQCADDLGEWLVDGGFLPRELEGLTRKGPALGRALLTTAKVLALAGKAVAASE